MIVAIEMTGEQQLLAAFTQLENVFDDLSPIFEDLADPVFGDIRRRIDSHPGPPLAASTIKAKGHSRILRDKDDLYGSFEKGAAGNILRIEPLSGEYGTSDPKAMFHQTGTARMPKRTIIEVTGEQEARYTKIAVEKLSKRIKEIGFET